MEIIKTLKSKRHRRTKAEMELAREFERETIDENDAVEKAVAVAIADENEAVSDIEEPKKRHRRTKAEMNLAKVETNVILKHIKPIFQSHVNKTIKLKCDHNEIPKDTILTIIDTPNNEKNDDFCVWVKYNDEKKKIMKFNAFFVR